ncbi:hypothetical protein ACVC7V_17375 [Hydrogenophaga sp. A37]|uniref:hypothetical protein n=1 Tax=Hydrogenophaga sp. A37 TaxID=1945864 RepID=UPI0009844F6E|nr:hypothetical protein [Hydrogenophaga sp. A37]OOG79193.1 hypothetical protein B0E41_25565 [Hydrogenophaga sp. A37]
MNTTEIHDMPTNQEDQALQMLVKQLVVIADQAPDHQLLLVALMSIYKAVAITHPCCTAVAAQTALQVGGELLIRSLGTQSAGPIH